MAGHLLNPPEQGLEVEPRSADNDGSAPPPEDSVNCRIGFLQPTGRVIADQGIHAPDEVVGNASPGFRRCLGRQEGNSPVNLKGIGADDLASQAFGQQEGKFRLAGPGGAGNEDCFRRKHGNRKETVRPPRRPTHPRSRRSGDRSAVQERPWRR